MSNQRGLVLLSCFFLLTPGVRSARASDDPATTTITATAAPAQDDDENTLQLAEPDFRLINLPTTLRLPLFKSNFDLTHRFNGNLRHGDFGDQASHLFGIDEGAAVGFEYRFAVARHVELAAFRTAIDRTIQIYTKVDALHQRESLPVSASLVLSVEGSNNLQDNHAPAVGLSLSHTFGEIAAVYLVPTFVHNTAAVLGLDRNTTFLGFGARIRIRPTVYVAAEGSPRLSGYAPGKAQYGFALEKRAGGHMFQLNFTNGQGTTFAQVARGGQPNNLGMGFNLSRKFF